MIVNENLTIYLHSLQQDVPYWLEEKRNSAAFEGVPIIRREMESFLRVLLSVKNPSRILEIGTGTGYSALFMEQCAKEAEITTIENYEPRLRKARENFAGHPAIKLLEGDARDLLGSLEGGFDFIFLDAAKGQYISMLPQLRRLLVPGGILAADNVLQDGELIRSRYAMPRRQRTIHSRMREFIWEITHDSSFTASLVTQADGVLLAVRNSDEKQEMKP